MEIRSDLMDSHVYAFKRLAVSAISCIQINFIRQDSICYYLVSYRSVLQEVLDQKPTFRSLKQDVLPYLVRRQLVSWIRSLQMRLYHLFYNHSDLLCVCFPLEYQRSDVFSDDKIVEENGNGKNNMQNNEVVLSQILSNASLPSFHQVYESVLNGRKTHKCCVYIADESKYCIRLNSIQAFMDVNRDVSC